MKLFRIIAIVCLGLVVGSKVVNAQPASTSSYPLDYVIYVPCMEEMAYGTIYLHETFHPKGNGVFNIWHMNAQGGELKSEKGNVYRPAGYTESISSSQEANGTWTVVHMLDWHFVGKGGIQLRLRFKITTNAEFYAAVTGPSIVQGFEADVVCE